MRKPMAFGIAGINTMLQCRSVFIALILSILAALSVSAQGVITFNAATNLAGLSGTNYVESGVRFSSSGGNMYTRWGQGSKLLNSTPYLVFDYPFGRVSISLTNGQPFGLASVELADPQTLTVGSVEIVFKGFRANGSMVTNRFTTPGNQANTFGYFQFTSEFSSGLTNVEVSVRFAMDNLKVLTGTPPPAPAPGPVLPKFETIIRPVGTNIGALTTGDFNRDGKADVVISVPGGMRFYHGTGDGTFSNAVEYACATNALYSFLAAADLNDDGRLDLVASRQGEVATFLNSPPTGFAVATQSFASFYPVRLAVADLNQDRKPDLAIVSNSGLLVALGNGDGLFGSQTNYTYNSAQDVAAADFNEDGLMDIAVAGYNSVGIFSNIGNGVLGLSQNYSNEYARTLIIGDFNNDAHLDIAGLSYNGITIRLNNGRWFWIAKSYYFYYPLAGVVADFNGDNNPDIIIRGQYDEGFFMGNGDGTFFPKSQAKNSSQIRTADFDGDDLPDFVATQSNSIVVSLNKTPPPLRLTPLPGYNQISWPSVFGDAFTVEYSFNPLDSRSWKPFPYPPVLIGTERAIADWTDAPQKFYRLSKPTRQ